MEETKSDDNYGSVPDINTETIGRGTEQMEGLTVIKTIPMDEIDGGGNTTYAPKPY